MKGNSIFKKSRLMSYLLGILLFCQYGSNAQTFNFTSSEGSAIRTASQLYHHTLPDTITVWCNDWNTILANPTTWKNLLKFKSNNAFVKFYVDHFYPKSQLPYTYQLTYQVYGYANNPALDSTTYTMNSDTLTISNFNHDDPHNAYQDIQLAHFGNFYKMMVVITDIYSYNGGVPPHADLSDSARWDFNVEGSILTQKYDKTNYGTGSSIEINATAVPSDNYIDLAFNLPGASHPVQLTPVNYELEWTYVDDYTRDVSTGSISSISASSLHFDFLHNSTRVWLDSDHYRLPLVYPGGYLVYRARMVRPDSTLFRYPVYSDWSYGTADAGTVGSVGTASKYHITTPYQGDSTNWQYTISFAEGGKYKHVLSFYDGLLKNRESITRFNSNMNKILVTKNIYDFEGRPCIKTLPTPVPSSSFSYQYNVDLNSVTGLPYVSGDFDTGFHICPGEPTLAPLSTSALANIYYSHLNSDTVSTSFQKFVPDAGGYPLVQTIFSPAYNDRVDKQGGAGDKLQIADSNIISNFYVTTQQVNLNRLFGLDAGWNSYYNMTVSKDPNKQLSMSIKDYEGKQLVTSMIGTGPNPLDHAINTLSVPGASYFGEDVLLHTPQFVIDDKRIADKTFFNQVAGNDSIKYIYQFSPYPVCPSQYLSVKAHYYYELTDRCGDTVFSQDSTLGITGVVSHPVAFSGSTGLVHLEAGPYTVHKELSIDPNEIDAAIDSFINGPNCLLDEPWFIRRSVESRKFPCPELIKDPCVLKKQEMMYDLYPGGIYAGYKDSAGFVRGVGEGSIFDWNPCFECPGHYTYLDSCLLNRIPDSIVINGIHYYNLHGMPVDSFIMVYKLSVDAGDNTIAEALLPLHPEFCKGCIYDTFKTMMLAIPDAATAERFHLLNLDSIIAHDPLRTFIAGNGHDSLATFPGGAVRLDFMELAKLYCGCGDSIMLRECYNHIYSYEISNGILTGQAMKDKYFTDVVNIYFANRTRYVDDYLFTTTSDTCEKCSSSRFKIKATATHGISSWGTPTDELYDSVWASGDSTASWMLRMMSGSTTIDTATLALYTDSMTGLYYRFDSLICHGTVDTIMAHLSSCNDGSSLILGRIRFTLDSLCAAHAVPRGEFTPEIVRKVILDNGGILSDVCNPYLVGYSKWGSTTPPSIGSCLPGSFFTDVATSLNRPGALTSFIYPGVPHHDTLDHVHNSFEYKVWTALGASTDYVITNADYNSATGLYKLNVFNDPATAPPVTDTVKIYLRGTGTCGSIFAAGITDSVVISDVSCLKAVPGTFITGLIGEYSFVATVADYGTSSFTSCSMLGWTDTIQTMPSTDNMLTECVPCTQMRALYNEFTDTLRNYGITGTDHPLHDKMLGAFMSTRLPLQFTVGQYAQFIESCALADSVFLPQYVGYSNLIFPTRADADTFMARIDRLNPPFDFDQSYRDSSASGFTISLNFGPIPISLMASYRHFIHTYSGATASVTDTALSYLQGANVMGFMFAIPGTTIPSPSTIFGAGGTVRFSAPQTRGVWLGSHYELQDFYYVIDSPGVTKPYEVSRDVYELRRYLYGNGIPAIFVSNFQSTVNADYFKPLKQDYLKYTYSYQSLPPYQVLDSVQTQYLTSRIPSYNYKDVTYNKPFDPTTITNLYIADSTMTNRFFDTLVFILNTTANVNTVDPTHIFFDTNAVAVFHSGGGGGGSSTSGSPLWAYRCSDGTYWYRYFGRGDTMYNVYVAMPEWLPRSLHKLYKPISVGPPKGIAPGLGDSTSRFFTLNMRKPGDTTVLQARGMTNFVIGRNEELDNVLLGGPLTTYNVRPKPDTFNNCERQLLRSAVRQGIIDHQNYIDSTVRVIRAGFMDYMLHHVTEQLIVEYQNQEFGYTLYYYDRAGNLDATVPPVGVNPLTITLGGVDGARDAGTTSPTLLPAHTKVTNYYYNTINQVTSQNTPDAGATRFYYDAAGRLVFSQNAKQADGGRYTYNLYDQQNRIFETGEAALGCPYFDEYVGSDTSTVRPSCYYTYPYDFVKKLSIFSSLPSAVKNVASTSHAAIITLIHSMPRTDVVYTAYDAPFARLDTIPGMDAQQNLRSRVAAVLYYKQIMPSGTMYDYATHYSYDADGNVKTLVQDCPQLAYLGVVYGATKRSGPHQMRFKRIDYDYDLISGKVNLLSYNRGFADQYYQRYNYDADNRIAKVETSSDGYIWHRDAEYAYYQHGPLARVDVGDLRVQGMDYAYTVQGWLKTMNSDTMDMTQDMGRDGDVTINAKDAVAYSIDYFKDDYTAISPRTTSHVANLQRNLYNGNISRVTNTIGDFLKLSRQYAYDQLNRINTADYSTVDPVTKALTGLNDYKSRYSYDMDGNITSLVRYGNDAGSGAQLMDSLNYRYGTGSGGYTPNQLKHLEENAADVYSNDIKYNMPTAGSTPTYTYDRIGNTLTDNVSTGRFDIHWNLYNKVTQLDSGFTKIDTIWSYVGPRIMRRTWTLGYTTGLHIHESFDYDGAGNRVAKHYAKDSLGRNWFDEYYVRDAQGNILAIYKAANQYATGMVFPVATATWAAGGSLPGTGGGGGGTTGGGTLPGGGRAWTGGIGGGEIIPGTTRMDYIRGMVLPRLGSMPGFREYIVGRASLDAGMSSMYMSMPRSFMLGVSPLMYDAVVHSGTGYIPDMVTREKAGIDTILGPALDTLMEREPADGAELLEWLLTDTALGSHVLALADSASSTDSVLEAVAHALGIDTIAPVDTIAKILETTRDHDLLVRTLAGVLGDKPAVRSAYMELLAVDSLIYANNLCASPAGAYQNKLKDVAARYGDKAKMLALMDASAAVDGMMGHAVDPADLMAGAYDLDPGTFVANMDSVMGPDYLDTAIMMASRGRPEGWYDGRGFWCDHCGVDPYVLPMSTILNKAVFGLAEHDIYGSSRLGTKNYLPTQIGVSFDSLAHTADTIRLWERKPWYSEEYKDVIAQNQLSPYGNTLTAKYVTAHIAGQKQYELTDQLGDVLATVSDLRMPDDTVRLHTINFYKPVVQSAYDYYPFGMLMPGRNTEDNTSHCVTLTETKLVMRIVPSFSVWTVPDVILHGGGSVVITPGTGTHTGGGVLISPSNPEAYATYDMSALSIPLGIPQSIRLDVGDVSRMMMAQLIQDDTMMIGSNMIPMAADISVNIMFTPVSSNLKLKLSYPMGGGVWTGGSIKVWGTSYGSDTIYEAMPLVTTECTDGMYRYGNNGKFKDNEWAGVGNHYNFGARLQDSRTTRFLSKDPVMKEFPDYSPYAFANNSPIMMTDEEGNHAKISVTWNNGKVKLQVHVAHYQSRANLMANIQKGVSETFNNAVKHNKESGWGRGPFTGVSGGAQYSATFISTFEIYNIGAMKEILARNPTANSLELNGKAENTTTTNGYELVWNGDNGKVDGISHEISHELGFDGDNFTTGPIPNSISSYESGRNVTSDDISAFIEPVMQLANKFGQQVATIEFYAMHDANGNVRTDMNTLVAYDVNGTKLGHLETPAHNHVSHTGAAKGQGEKKDKKKEKKEERKNKGGHDDTRKKQNTKSVK